MTDNKIATLINNTLIPNVFGGDSDGYTIAEDLRGIVDLGIALSSIDGDTLKDAQKKFAIGVIKNYFDERSYKGQYFGFVMDSVEYGGAIQRTRAKLLKAMDTAIVSLEDYNADSSAPDYHDGHFYGVTTASKLYTTKNQFKTAWSLSGNQFKKYFKDEAGVRSYVAMIENVADNTLEFELETLTKGILRKLILSCNASRKIELLTTYNTEFGLTGANAVKLTNWKQNADFLRWCQALIINLKKYMTDYNKKYNDGTVEVFCPQSDVKTCLLTEFDTALTFNNANVWHNELTNFGEAYTVNHWQNGSEDILPYIASGSVHDQIVEKVADAGAAQNTTIDHCVGIIYDKYSAGVGIEFEKISTEYVGAEDFTTYFAHVGRQLWIDTASSAVILTLS